MIGILSVLGLLDGAGAADWPVWRGPNGDGTAGAGTNVDRLPLTWSSTSNVVWKADLPGEGHSTPIVVGDKVVLTISDEETERQSVLCLSRSDGSVLWDQPLFYGKLAKKIHKKNTHATPSPASDGERVYVSFFNDEEVQLTALSLGDGTPIWQVTAGPFKELFNFGYAPSPLLYGDLVIVSSDFKRGGFLAAYDKRTGTEVWRTPRTGSTSYSSPIVGRVGGRDQLLISGDKRISSYDPATGRPLWSAKAVTEATCGTLVWDEERVFGSGGFPGKETAAVMADGSGRVVWKNKEKSYEQSMLVHDGYLYTVNDGGIGYCWDATTGEEKWEARVSIGAISASPLLVGDRIYASFENGVTVVFRATPTGFEKLAENRLGVEAFASPVVAGDRLFLRVADYEGEKRRETLYCLGL